jgi:DNA-binding beta-propeller fold protein YncE
VAGSDCLGSAPQLINSPDGIFVTINLDLFVADSKNDLLQLFRFGKKRETTAVGKGATGIFIIFRPTGITLDVDGNRCVVGCSKSGGDASNQLTWPFTMSFDRLENILVTDGDDNRIQKFVLLNNSCGE